jgi:tripartite-type tricarboxylate transporter receptor subunit TctC
MRAFLVLAFQLLLASSAAAQDFPNRPIKMIVPYAAGGLPDTMTRIVQIRAQELLGQPIVVENRGGAGGNIGAETVANAESDGYTLLLTAPPPLTINGSLYKKLPFDPAKAFAPIALIASVPIVLVVNPSVQAKNVGELIALAKAKPGSLNFGSSGIGSTNHLAGELLKSMAGVDVVHVPYRGAAPAMNDLLTGQIPFMFDNMPAVLPQVRGKAINAIAVAGAKRADALADVPVVADTIPGFEASSWFGLVAPAKTPAPALAKLSGELETILKMPDVSKRLGELGAEPGTVFGPAFGQFMADETTKWGKLVKASGATVE